MPAPPAGAWTWPIRRWPIYSTIIQNAASQRGELRMPLMVYPRWNFELDFNYIKGDNGEDESAMAAILGFYMGMQGPGNDWLYEDPFDNTVTAAEGVMFSLAAPGTIASGDGITTQFQLGRLIASIGNDIIQNVNLADTLAITINGTPTEDFVLGPTGVVTFIDPPASDAVLGWSGNFLYRCRFVDDELSTLNMWLPEIWELKGLKFISIIL
jgi:uncharacterized protein (TIGR02217 family)